MHLGADFIGDVLGVAKKKSSEATLNERVVSKSTFFVSQTINKTWLRERYEVATRKRETLSP